MSNYNHYQSNAGHQQGGHHPAQPPNPYGQPSNNPQQQNMSYASLGSSSANSHAHHAYYSGASGVGQNYSNQAQYGAGPPNNNQAFSYSTLGTYGSLGANGQMHYSGNNHASMAGSQMNGSAAAPSYASMEAAHQGGNQRVMSRWGNPQPQQQHQQQYSQQGYPNYSYNQSQQPMAPSYHNVSYMHNNGNASVSHSSGFHQDPPRSRQQQNPLPVAIPPPPPPPPASYLTDMQGELAASARREREASREDVPKKPPPPAPKPPPAAPPNEPSANVMLTDSAVSAINALSNLDSRWSATSGAGKKARRGKRKRRNRKKKNADNDDWIDVDHEPTTKKQQHDNEGQKEFDLAAGVESNNFPPLAASESKGEGSDGSDAPRLASLEDMTTSQLTSYAAVLGRALDETGDGADTTSESQEAPLPADTDDGEEMDISDEEEAVEVVDLTEDVPQNGLPVKGDQSAPRGSPDSDSAEKEKRSLKLAELRAKAKLARAKLRIAEQKKARGGAARASLESTTDNEPAIKLKGLTPRSSPRSSPLHPTASSISARPPDITALRNIGSLVISGISATGPADEVSFVDSLYRDIQGLTRRKPPARTSISPPPANLEENRKKSESLKQQLHLAKLQLELKKKSLKRKELEKKKKEAQLDTNKNEGDEQQPTPPPSPARSQFKNKMELLQLELKKKSLKRKELGQKKREALFKNEGDEQKPTPPPSPLMSPFKKRLLDEDIEKDERLDDVARETDGEVATNVQEERLDGDVGTNNETGGDSLSTAKAKLEQLRHRQKELKQKNDIASLRNLIHRQRDLLQGQGQELAESSAQLQSCVDGIRTKQDLLDKSEQKLEELHHRKRIMVGMVSRATEQLMAARKALNERRRNR